jgi:hypothetical protein
MANFVRATTTGPRLWNPATIFARFGFAWSSTSEHESTCFAGDSWSARTAGSPWSQRRCESSRTVVFEEHRFEQSRGSRLACPGGSRNPAVCRRGRCFDLLRASRALTIHEQLRLGLLLVPYGFKALAGGQECSLPAMRAPLRMPGVQDSCAA